MLDFAGFLLLLPTILVNSAAPPVLPSATFTAPKDDLPDGISELKLLTASDAGVMRGRLVMTVHHSQFARPFFEPTTRLNCFLTMQLNTTTSIISVQDACTLNIEGISLTDFGGKLCKASGGDSCVRLQLSLHSMGEIMLAVDCLEKPIPHNIVDVHEIQRAFMWGIILKREEVPR